MEDQSFLFGAIGIMGIVTLATTIYSLCKKIDIPYPVGLLLGGCAVQAFLMQTDSPYFAAFRYFSFSPEIVFYVFLPTLIFESAYHINFRQFRNVLQEVTILAIVGMVISMFIIAYGVHTLAGFPWGPSLIFGALISATDPVAVLAIFRDVRAPKRLVTIVDGESLLNDGTSLIIFQLLKAVFITGAVVLTPTTFVWEAGHFFIALIEGVLVGIVAGFIIAQAIAHAPTKGVQLMLSLILAHITFIVSEGLLHVSGILATMAAGMVMGNYGRRKLTQDAQSTFHEIWTFLEFSCNSLIFLLLGMALAKTDFITHWKLVLISAAVALFIARPVSVFVSFFITNLFREKGKKISFKYQVITAWGGIHGALAAAAVLLVPESFPYAEELQAMTAGGILSTFLINALTISPLLRKLKITDLSFTERMQQHEARVLINEKVCERLKRMRDMKYISEHVYGELEDKYARGKLEALASLDELHERGNGKNEREVEKILSHFSLGIEMYTYEKLRERGEISDKRFRVLRESIYRQIERLERNELPDERGVQPKVAPTVPKHLNIKPAWLNALLRPFAEWRRNHLILERMQHYRARRIASWKVVRQFEMLEKDHTPFRDYPVIEKIIKRYRLWNRSAEKKLEHLGNQFPTIIQDAHIRIAEGFCLEFERDLEEEFLRSGLITEKVYDSLDEDMCARRKCMRQAKTEKLWIKNP